MADEFQIRKNSVQNSRNEMLFLYLSTIWAKPQSKYFDKFLPLDFPIIFMYILHITTLRLPEAAE